MKKRITVTRQESKALQHHRVRYQGQRRQEPKGIPHRCECKMLLGARDGNVWHIHKSDLRVRIAMPCLWLEIDCPACGKTNLIEEYQKPELAAPGEPALLM